MRKIENAFHSFESSKISIFKSVYPAAGHVITDNLKIISDSRIRSIIAKGPKYKFPVQIDFQKCREKLQDLSMTFVIVGVIESILSVVL